jgi:hypothetical protein
MNKRDQTALYWLIGIGGGLWLLHAHAASGPGDSELGGIDSGYSLNSYDYVRLRQDLTGGGVLNVQNGDGALDIANAHPSEFAITSLGGGYYKISLKQSSIFGGFVNAVTPSAGSGSSQDTKAVQAALNRWPSNLPRLAVDGKWGAKTTARIAEFQRQHGLFVSYVVDAATSAALFSGGSTPSNSGGSTASNTAPSNTNSSPPPNPPSFNVSSVLLPLGLVLAVGFALRD